MKIFSRENFDMCTIWHTSTKELVAFVDTTCIKTIGKQLLTKYSSVQENHGMSKTAVLLLKVASCCNNAMMSGVLANFSMKARTIPLIRLSS